MLGPEVQTLLSRHTSLQYDKEKNKVVCHLTKHEMPVTGSAIKSYVQGRKYQNATRRSFDYDQFKPHIVPSTKKHHTHELFCFLTLRHLAKSPQAVERHVSGKRYKRALAKWTKCQETGEKFVPRGGSKQRKKDTGLDAGSHQWSDDSVDEVETDDDMEDLYPAEIFGTVDEESENEVTDEYGENEISTQKGLVLSKAKIETGSDNSDYDMGVLDSGANGTNELQEPSLIPDDTLGKKINKQKKKVGTKNMSKKDQDELKSSVSKNKRKVFNRESPKHKKKKF